MRILVVTQYFWPETFRINDLVEALTQSGHEVTVLTGLPNYPQGRIFENYSARRGPWSENYKGARLIRVPLFPRGRGGSLRLSLNYLSFVASATCLGLPRLKGRFDLCFVFATSPITAALPAIALKKLRSVPLSLWVQDLWPESVLAVGAVKSKFFERQIGRLVSFIYKHCDSILIQSMAFKESVLKWGADPAKVEYLPNWAESFFGVAPASLSRPEWLAQVPQNSFKVCFAGNIGRAQDFETILAAAHKLKDHREISWVIVGDGTLKDHVQAEARRLGLDNFHLLGRKPIEEMPALFASMDALLVTLKRDPIFALTVPSKVQSYLASGRPIVAGIDGEGARIIEESRAGLSCPAESPDRLAQAILDLSRLTDSERAAMGARGRAYYESSFDRDQVIRHLEDHMRSLAGHPKRSGRGGNGGNMSGSNDQEKPCAS